MNSFFHSSRNECLACVLGVIPLQAVEILLKVDASTAAFFFFFLLSFFPHTFKFCTWMLAGNGVQVRAGKCAG